MVEVVTQRTALADVLRRYQWGDQDSWFCMVCSRYRVDGHRDDCLLMQTVAELEA
jgi:hypothetical protein